MATVQINNTLPIRIEAGGQIILNDGTDDLVLNLHELGSLNISPGGYNLGRYNNYGIPKTPILGDKQRTSWRVSAKVTTELATANKLMDLSQQVNSAAGLVKLFSLIVKAPNVAYGNAGQMVTLAEAYFLRGCQYVEGAEFDMLEAEGESNLNVVTLGTY